jgi:hypothetical protein
MPLYKQATNLQGRGNFAPGVTYYAGIKAPTPAAPSLPKGNYNFNIDLTPIGDAFIHSQELEAKKLEGEADREFRLGLAEMEDARMRELEAMRDAREREFHADDVDYNNKKLAIDSYNAWSTRDLGLRRLELDKEKEKNSKENKEGLRRAVMSDFDGRLQSIYNRLDQQPNTYSREQAQEDVYNLFNTFRNVYPDLIDVSSLHTAADRYGLGFKAAGESQIDMDKERYKADYENFKAMKEAVPSLKTMNPNKSYQLVVQASKDVDLYREAEATVRSPWTTDEQRATAMDNMHNSGIDMAKINVLSRISAFASTPLNPTDRTNYVADYQALRTESINNLSRIMPRNLAEGYVDVALVRMNARGFLQSYNKMHKTSADVANNVLENQVNQKQLEYFIDIPQYQQMLSLGINLGQVAAGNPKDVFKIEKLAQSLMNRDNNITFDTKSRTYVDSNSNVRYSPEDAVTAMNITGVKDPEAALSIISARRMRNAPTLVDQGLADSTLINDTTKTASYMYTKPGQISTLSDVETVRRNVESLNIGEQYLKCKRHTGTDEAAQTCVILSHLPRLLIDRNLINQTFQIANSTSIMGNPKAIGYKVSTDGTQLELGFTDDGVDWTADNINHLKDLEKTLNAKHDVPVETKISFIKLFKNTKDLQYVPNSYKGTFITEGNTVQKALSATTEADRKISQLHDEETE